MRRIIYIPAVHVKAELNGFENTAQARLYGLDSETFKYADDWAQEYWKQVKQILEEESINPSKARVYAKGAVFPRKQMIPLFQEWAQEGSHHFQIVLDLLRKGAKYEITESPELYLKHEQAMRIQEELSVKIEPLWKLHTEGRLSEESERTLNHYINRMGLVLSLEDSLVISNRDKKIASRINNSLKEEETGILILGSAHRVSPWLDPDIDFRPLRQELVELTRGDSGKGEITPQAESETPIVGQSEAKG